MNIITKEEMENITKEKNIYEKNYRKNKIDIIKKIILQ